MSVASFVQQFLPQAQSVSNQTGLPVDYVLGQAGLESGWGTSNAAVTGNNFFGISPGGTLASYASPSAGFAAYGSLVSTPNYSSAIAAAAAGGSAQQIAQSMNDSGYSTTPDYAARVSSAVSAVDSALGINGGGTANITPSGGSTDVAGGTSAASGGSTGGTTSTSAASGCGFNPLCWLSGLGTYLAGFATRGALILLAILLLLGAVYLFASRTQQVQTSPA